MSTRKRTLKGFSQTAIKVTHAQLETTIIKYYLAKRALFIWGTMGIGKSFKVRDAARKVAAELGLKIDEKNLQFGSLEHINDPEYFLVIDIRLSQCDPSDLRGIPVWQKDRDATKWLPPTTFPRAGYGFIFFDELNLAPNLVQASAYQFILDRGLGEYQVPDGYGVLAAGNRLEDRANVFDMAAPLSNRMGHVQLDEPPVQDWSKWALNNDIDPRIVGYLNFKQGSLYQFDPNAKEKAFGTPRTWHFASDLIKDIPTSNLASLKLFVGSLVGEGEATSFTGFLQLRKHLRPIKEYFEHAKTITLPEKMDLQWALVTSIVEYYKANMKKSTKIFPQLVDLLKRLSEEYAVFTMKMIHNFDKDIQNKLGKHGDAVDLATKLWKFIM